MTPSGLDSDYTSEEEGSGTIGLFFCLPAQGGSE